MTKPATPAPAGELLYGVKAIASFLGITPRQALYLAEKRAFPFWKEDRAILAKRDSLRRWMEEREAAARG